jgi:hypothetical protein
MVILGYDPAMKGYCMFNFAIGQLHISMDENIDWH